MSLRMPGITACFLLTSLLLVVDCSAEIQAPQSSNAALQEQIDALRRRIDRPAKDIWDKITALSGFSSGILVALIGFYATVVYNNRQRVSEGRRKDQELLIGQIQTVEKFIPHLSSGDEHRKAAALIAINALGNGELAVKLARAFPGQGGTTALSSIASTAGPNVAERATEALRDVLSSVASRVVTVNVGDERRATGLLIGQAGLFLTATYAITDLVSKEPLRDISIRFPTGKVSKAYVSKLDQETSLALLQTEPTEDTFLPIVIASGTPSPGEAATVFFINADNEPNIQVGLVSGLGKSGKGRDRIILSLTLIAEVGSSGAPVVDKEGRLLGVLAKRDLERRTIQLIPASDISAFLPPLHAELGRVNTI